MRNRGQTLDGPPVIKLPKSVEHLGEGMKNGQYETYTQGHDRTGMADDRKAPPDTGRATAHTAATKGTGVDTQRAKQGMVTETEVDIIECPKREYRVVPAPAVMHWRTEWPIPAPEVIRDALANGLRGLWIDHVPTGAEIAAMKLLLCGIEALAWSEPLATGDWDQYPVPTWGEGHPEGMSPQMAMPDSWFDHREGRKAPLPLTEYTPRSGRTVNSVAGMAMSGSENRHYALELPALWRRGLLRSPGERALAHEVLHNIDHAPTTLWYQLVLDEEWTIRQAAEVLREAGIYAGEICAWTNRWARAPAGTPPARSAPQETAWEVSERCSRQVDENGPWPIARTAEIAEERNYERVR